MIAPRSPVVQTGIRAASPLAVVVATYLFFAGHNQPGGGFAAGLVLGAVVALRMVTGMAVPVRADVLLAVGGVLAAVVAVAPLLLGQPLLDQVVVESTVPVLGKVKSGSAQLFDAGVAAIVVGLVLAVMNGLGVEQMADPPVPAQPEDDRSVREAGLAGGPAGSNSRVGGPGGGGR